MPTAPDRSGPVRRPALWWVLAAAIALIAAPAVADSGALEKRARDLIGEHRLLGSSIGVSAVDVQTGRTLINLDANRPMIPASNQKLLSSGVALALLGPDHVFRTEVLLWRDRLVVRGSGDPAFGDPALLGTAEPQMSVEDLLERIASAVERSGVRRFAELVIDDRVFDRDLAHPSWPEEQLNRWYCAEVSGLNFHTNVLSVYPRPAPDGPGTPPTFNLEPRADWLEIRNRARTVGTGQNTPWIARRPASNDFTLFGDVRTPAQVPVRVSVHNPAMFFGSLLAERLRARGIVIGPDRPLSHEAGVRLAERDEPIQPDRVLVVVTTLLHDVLRRCNADSYNLYAEALIKLAGHALTGDSGSWESGAAAVRMVLGDRLGPDHASSVSIADGSGMSRDNAISPATMTAWLRVVRQDARLAPHFIASLPMPSEGTLRSRFRDTELRNVVLAKSGTLSGVRCLSGYIVHPETGRTIAFSILCNDLRDSNQERNARQYHESIVLRLDRWLSENPGEVSTRAHAEEPAMGG